MFSYVTSGAVYGISSYLMQVETDISDGLPSLVMTGSVSGSVREAGERVRVALKNAGYRLPPMRITVNFSPADIPKRDVVLDLPMAAGILIGMGVIRQSAVDGMLLAGELGLDGEVRPIRGVLPMVEEAARQNIGTCILPYRNAREGAVAQGTKVIGVHTLQEMIAYLQADTAQRQQMIAPACFDVEEFLNSQYEGIPDFAEVHGQQGAKRVLEIAAAGFHNALMVGPPGSGKSMLAHCLPGIMPPFSREECIEVTRVYSVAGLLPEDPPLITRRPCLSPHHSITPQALAGGGTIPSPGMISLAHRGVLFLDELPEFAKDTINLLRQPMEEHQILISRAQGSALFPARSLVLGAMNPCPCGYYPDYNRCHCTRPEINRYRQRVPDPIMDRFDLCVDVPRVPVAALMERNAGEESSSKIRARVMEAVERQRKRFAGTEYHFNAEMNGPAVDRFIRLDRPERLFIREVFDAHQLSARAYHKTLKVARTISDLEGSDRITEDALAEAVAYRLPERRSRTPESADTEQVRTTLGRTSDADADGNRN